MLRLPQITLDDVLISEKLGNGQFGDVFRAVYRRPNDGSLVEVAIKKLKIAANDHQSEVSGESGGTMSEDEKRMITLRFVREASKKWIVIYFWHNFKNTFCLLSVCVCDRY